MQLNVLWLFLTRTSGKSTQNALMFRPYRKPPKHSLKRLRLSFSNCRCMKLASRSAMLSLSSAKAGSSDARGSEVLPDSGPEGVVCEARREVREGGRRGVVGRECVEGLRLWVCEGVAIVDCLWGGFVSWLCICKTVCCWYAASWWWGRCFC